LRTPTCPCDAAACQCPLLFRVATLCVKMCATKTPRPWGDNHPPTQREWYRSARGWIGSCNRVLRAVVCLYAVVCTSARALAMCCVNTPTVTLHSLAVFSLTLVAFLINATMPMHSQRWQSEGGAHERQRLRQEEIRARDAQGEIDRLRSELMATEAAVEENTRVRCVLTSTSHFVYCAARARDRH
jgi:hypothetical protein